MCVGFVVKCYVVVKGDGFGVDEVFFEIGVDYVSCIWSFGVLIDGLGVCFFWVYGEVGDEVE